MSLNQNIGEKIKKLREKKGFTRKDVAGKSYSHLGRVERGQANPCIEYLEAIAKKLQVEVIDFFK